MQERIKIFRSVAILQIIYLASTNSTVAEIIDFVNKIQKGFLWKNSKPKIKLEKLCKSYENGGFKILIYLKKIEKLDNFILLKDF